MQRRALLAVVALSAAVAFAAGATAFDDAVSRSTGIDVGDGDHGSTSPNDESAPRGTDSASDPNAGGCLLCGISARSLVAGLFPRVNPLALGGVAVVVAVLAAFAGLRTRPDTVDPVDLSPERDDESQAAADDGASPTQPSDAPATNDVYRTWRDMRDRVPVEFPENATPGECAAAAVDAGFERGAVRRLTALFRAVRYGDAQPTADRQRAARAAFDALEPEEDA